MKTLKLLEYRKKFNYTQKQVADLMNVTQSAYSLWELEKRMPNADQIVLFCKIFKCNPGDLFTFYKD